MCDTFVPHAAVADGWMFPARLPKAIVVPASDDGVDCSYVTASISEDRGMWTKREDATGKCEECRICSPSALDKTLLLSLTWLMTLRLLCNAEPCQTRCPICGHPLRYHNKRAAV